MDVSNFVCCICQNIPDSVAESGCCHSLFCWDCVLENGRIPCPSCGKTLEPEMCNENVAIQKLIERIPTYCKYVGCGALVTPSTLKSHSAQCEYATVMCPNSDLCGFMTRKELPLHEREECAFRSVNCHSCDDPMPLNQLQAHLDHDCPGVIVQCTNNCLTKGITRSQLARHMVEECPYSPVVCPFAANGCEHVVLRSQLDAHLRDDVSKHLLMTTAIIETQQREIAQLRNQVNHLQAAVPLLSLQQIQENVYNQLADFQPVIDKFSAAVKERLRWSSVFWLILIWIGFMSVHFLVRWFALGFLFTRGYKIYVRSFRNYLASRSDWHVKVVDGVYFMMCTLLFLLVAFVC